MLFIIAASNSVILSVVFRSVLKLLHLAASASLLASIFSHIKPTHCEPRLIVDITRSIGVRHECAGAV